MVDLIDAACEGIAGINSALNDDDLISVIDFAVDQRTIFPYLKRSKVDWNLLNTTLRDDVDSCNRGSGTALWDAIGYVMKTTPRIKKFKEYKPELIIFTDGEDNSSEEYDATTIQEALGSPGIPHVHITIIDASPRGNRQLKNICAPINHCSYMKVKGSHGVITRAFTEVVTAVTRRLTATVEVSDDLTNMLAAQLGQLAIAGAEDEGNRGARDGGRGGRGRGRSGRGRGRRNNA